MQTAFAENLLKMRIQNKKRALLISATGTGKTYASAFALRQMHSKKVLFLVHREQIAKQAMKRVFICNNANDDETGNIYTIF